MILYTSVVTAGVAIDWERELLVLGGASMYEL